VAGASRGAAAVVAVLPGGAAVVARPEGAVERSAAEARPVWAAGAVAEAAEAEARVAGVEAVVAEAVVAEAVVAEARAARPRAGSTPTAPPGPGSVS